jgi:hypothetical protein
MSAHWDTGILFRHTLQTNRAVAQLTHLVVEFQEHLRQMLYIGGRPLTELLGCLPRNITGIL